MIKKSLDKLAKIVIPFFAFLLVRFIYLTSKKNYPTDLENSNEPIIIAAWHGELIFPPLFFRYFYRPKGKLFMMISEHKDGEYIANTFSYAK